MARTEKLSLTIDAEVLAVVRKRARAAKKTVSAYVSDELAEVERKRILRDLIAEFEREHGAIPASDVRKARAKLAEADRKMKKRRKTAA